MKTGDEVITVMTMIEAVACRAAGAVDAGCTVAGFAAFALRKWI